MGLIVEFVVGEISLLNRADYGAILILGAAVEWIQCPLQDGASFVVTPLSSKQLPSLRDIGVVGFHGLLIVEEILVLLLRDGSILLGNGLVISNVQIIKLSQFFVLVAALHIGSNFSLHLLSLLLGRGVAEVDGMLHL